MRKVLLQVLLCLTVSLSAAAQTGWVYTESKDGKVTHKECEGVYVAADTVVFVATKTSWQMFVCVGVSKEGRHIWVDHATGKVINRAMNDGKIIFWKTNRKAFYYEK